MSQRNRAERVSFGDDHDGQQLEPEAQPSEQRGQVEARSLSGRSEDLARRTNHLLGQLRVILLGGIADAGIEQGRVDRLDESLPTVRSCEEVCSVHRQANPPSRTRNHESSQAHLVELGPLPAHKCVPLSRAGCFQPPGDDYTDHQRQVTG